MPKETWRLGVAYQYLARLRSAVAARAAAAQAQLEAMRAILSPAQLIRYLAWIERSRDKLHDAITTTTIQQQPSSAAASAAASASGAAAGTSGAAGAAHAAAAGAAGPAASPMGASSAASVTSGHMGITSGSASASGMTSRSASGAALASMSPSPPPPAAMHLAPPVHYVPVPAHHHPPHHLPSGTLMQAYAGAAHVPVPSAAGPYAPRAAAGVGASDGSTVAGGAAAAAGAGVRPTYSPGGSPHLASVGAAHMPPARHVAMPSPGVFVPGGALPPTGPPGAGHAEVVAFAPAGLHYGAPASASAGVPGVMAPAGAPPPATAGWSGHA